MIPSEVDSWIDTQAQAIQSRGLSIGRIPLPSIRLRVSERKLLLILTDLIIVNGALALAIFLRGPEGSPPVWSFPKWFITLSVLLIACAVFFDLYNLASAASPWSILQKTLSAALVTTITYTFIPWFTPALGARSQTFLFILFVCVGLAGWRFLYARVFVQPWFNQRAIVVGAGAAAHELSSAVNTWWRSPDGKNTNYEIVAYIDDNQDLWNTSIQSIPVVGGHDLLLRMTERLDVDEVVLAITHRHAISNELMDILVQCSEAGIPVTTMGKLYERLFGRVPVDHLGRDLPRLLDMQESFGERLYLGFGRIADIIFGITGMAILAVVCPFVWIGNLFTSRGPLFYRQDRVGKGGQSFQIVKFRTMIPNAESDSGPVWASDEDPRATLMGKWMRRIRLDELPQMINVLRGEMSLIGPRPERPIFVEDLAKKLPFYRIRHCIRPGLTGWAQVQYRYASSLADSREKLEYDLYYIKHQGPFLDLQILVKTIAVVLHLRGT